MFVEVAINIPSDRTFTYGVTAESRSDVAVGKRVLVPFGKRSLTGYVIGIRRSTDRKDTREIIRVLDREPLFHEEDLRFYRWAADYYFTPLGRTLGEILPGGIDIESLLWAVKLGDADDLTPLQQDILESLGRRPSGMPLRSLEKELGKKTLLAELRKLEKRGLISLEERMGKPAVKGKREKIVTLLEAPIAPVKLTDRQGLALAAIGARGGEARVADLVEVDTPLPLLKALERKGLVRLGETETLRAPGTPAMIGRADVPVRLNPEQEIALGQILKGISSGVFSPCLLHGVTGSGKTEVYIHAITETLRQGGRAIYLVPEIALTPQLISRLASRFPQEEIAVLHSGIGPAVRYDQWRKIKRGDAKIVVGARSAVFAPVDNLRLIIIDEEHDSSYKQDERMPYNARDLAVVRAKQQGAAVVLGSATPGLQSFYNTREKEFVYLALTKRVEEREFPRVEIVDMK
ncbi:MAG TPA: primosomal protein N', partial [Syntrophales bacterium]